jgi:3',5'-cyclic AMP phosphodiesterase CpdA
MFFSMVSGCSDDAATGGSGGGTSSGTTPSSSSSGETSAGTTGGGAGGEGGAPVSLRIAVISDLNGSYGSTTYGDPVHAAVAALTDSIQPDVVLVTGDMVAGQQAGLDYEAMWLGFHAAVTSPLRDAGIPLAVTPGNHDASGYAAFAEEREIFVAQWTAPGRVPAVTMIDDSSYPLRYSFAHAGAFFLSLDATTVGPISAEQRDWVAAQLDGAAAYPIKIAYGHIPLHSVAVGREEEILADDALESLFRDHALTAYISGHHHAYYPGARDGLRLVSTSCIGDGPRALIGTEDATPRSVLQIDIEDGVITSLEALRSPDFTSAIDRTSLPESLSYDGKSITRDDLAGF